MVKTNQSRIKILDVTHFYASKSGGIKTYLDKKREFFEKLEEFPHVLLVPGEEDKCVKKGNQKIYYIKSPEVIGFKPYRLILNKKKLFKIIEIERPHIVEIGSPFLLPRWINQFKKRIPFKSIGFFHSNLKELALVFFKKRETFVKLSEKFIKWEFRECDLVLTPSCYVEESLKKLGFSFVETLYLGVDFSVFNYGGIQEHLNLRKKIFEEFNIPKNRILLLYTGRLSQDKNVMFLSEIKNLLESLYPERFFWIIIGAGPVKKKLKRKMKGNILFINYISSKKKLAEFYKGCDIFITPSLIETFGLTVVEAQACGLPVIAFKSGSIPEVTAFPFLLAQSKEEFVSNIIFLSKKLPKQDFGFKEQLYRWVKERFPWEKTFSKLIQIYQSLLFKEESFGEVPLFTKYC